MQRSANPAIHEPPQRKHRPPGRLRRLVVGALAALGMAAAGLVGAAAPAFAAGTATALNWSVSNSQTGASGITYSYNLTTATTATIGSVTMTVPSGSAGTPTVAANYGLGAGTVTLASNTLTYTVTTPVSVSSGTPLLIEIGGMTNTSTAGSYTSTLTTYNDASTPAAVDSGTTPSVTFGPNTTAVTVVVPESLTFTNDTPAFTLLPIPKGGEVSHVVHLSVETNAGKGYSLSAWTTPLDATSGSNTYTLPQGSSSGSSSLAVDTFAAQAALTTAGADGAALQGAYATAGNFVGYGTTSPGATIVSATGPTGNTADQVALTDATSVDYAQPAGTYTGTITYVATPNY